MGASAAVTATLLLNGNIHTLDSKLPHATALAIRDGKILAIGTDDSVRAYAPASSPAETVDLGGLNLLPGLTDAHIHFEWYSIGLDQVDGETATLAECLQRVADKAAGLPPGPWGTRYGREPKI